MRYFYCLLFAVSMFMGCSKDSPKENPNLIIAKFDMSSPAVYDGKEGRIYINKFEFSYSKTIDSEINFKVRFTGDNLDTIFNGTIEKGYTSSPTGFGDPLIIGITKEFKFASRKQAREIELISIAASDQKYKFKILPPRNLTD